MILDADLLQLHGRAVAHQTVTALHRFEIQLFASLVRRVEKCVDSLRERLDLGLEVGSQNDINVELEPVALAHLIEAEELVGELLLVLLDNEKQSIDIKRELLRFG